ELTRAVAGLLAAGLPLARALGAARTMLRPSMAATVDRIRARVEQGASLAGVLAEERGLFSALYIGLVRAGERSGDLAGTFRRLADHLEREAELRSKLVSASVYPLLLAAGGGAAVLVLLLVVLPRFADMLTASGARLPGSTAFLLALAGGLRAYWGGVIGLAIGVVAICAWCRSTAEGRRAAARLVNALPGLGALRRELVGARTARLLAVLLGGGAPVLAALDGTAEGIEDPLAREALEGIRARVREGAALHRAMEETNAFPPVLVQLTALGEETGRLAEFAGKAAQILEERVQRSVQRLVALAEPTMIVAFGGIVGFVALSLLQAIYSVNSGSFR
ncbi:MAG: type II secretion system F family protein, partial [Gemmatimonadales bacterium]